MNNVEDNNDISQDFMDINEKNKYSNYIIVVILYVTVVILVILLILGINLKNKKVDNTSTNKFSETINKIDNTMLDE